jgi:mannose-binding lectin 2
LTYYQDSYLKLELQHKESPEWTQCFKLNNVAIPSVAYLGFSAHTGELSDNHDIISVETKNLYTPNPASSKTAHGGSDKGPKDKQHVDFSHSMSHHGGGGWGWFLFKIVLFFLVVAGGYAGFTAWRAQSRGSRF